MQTAKEILRFSNFHVQLVKYSTKNHCMRGADKFPSLEDLNGKFLPKSPHKISFEYRTKTIPIPSVHKER